MRTTRYGAAGSCFKGTNMGRSLLRVRHLVALASWHPFVSRLHEDSTSGGAGMLPKSCGLSLQP